MEFLGELHPIVVHFPIALLIVYSLFETIAVFTKKNFLFKSAYLLLILGIIGSITSVLTGNQAEDLIEVSKLTASYTPSQLIDEHEEYATITLWYFTGVLVFRTYLIIKKKMDTKYKFLLPFAAVVGCYFLYQTGNYGGRIVHEYGIGSKIIEKISQSDYQNIDDDIDQE